MACAAVVLGLAAAPASQAEIVDIRWDDQGRFVHRADLAPGKFVELCGKLEAGQKVRWIFEAAAAMDFNIHHHEGKKVVFSAKLAAATRAAETLDVTSTQDYCWMWTHKGSAPAALSVSMQR